MFRDMKELGEWLKVCRYLFQACVLEAHVEAISWSRYRTGDGGEASWSKVCIQLSDDTRSLLIAVDGCTVPAGSARHARYSIRIAPNKVIREE